MTAQAMRELIKEEANMPIVTLEEQQRSTAHVGEPVQEKMISHVFHKSDLMIELQEEFHFKSKPKEVPFTDKQTWQKVLRSDETKDER